MEQTSGLTRECSSLWDGHSKAKMGREGRREGGDSCYNTLRRKGEGSIQKCFEGGCYKAHILILFEGTIPSMKIAKFSLW